MLSKKKIYWDENMEINSCSPVESLYNSENISRIFTFSKDKEFS